MTTDTDTESDTADTDTDNADSTDVMIFEGHKGVGFGVGPVPREVRERVLDEGGPDITEINGLSAPTG
jgi:hypothetical protein